MSNESKFNASPYVSFIWGICDDCLRDVYVRGKYRNVILPMLVIRRLDLCLEKTKQAVLKMKEQLDKANVKNGEAALTKASGLDYYNISPFTLRELAGRTNPQKLQADFEAYLNGFSPNVQDIINKFKFRNEIPTMLDADILGSVIEKFVTMPFNLSPQPILNDDQSVREGGLDNHAMGTIFEELLRKFNEENNEEAGEHFTPRDGVILCARLIIEPVAQKLKSTTLRLFDGAAGTAGMLTVGEQVLKEIAKKRNLNLSIYLFGQEINPETYAIATADMLMKGEGSGKCRMGFGSTLSKDAFAGETFDFELSNPPYGKSWKVDLEQLGGKDGIDDPRFVVSWKGESLRMIPRSSDGQLLFLLNNVAKMDETTELGTRIAEVHNGSSLFTGDAGSGESNARRYLIERDLVEAIIALPENMFYNTGIGTFVWVLSNRKDANRKGKIQLIDATEMKVPLRKNMGQKNCEVDAASRDKIMELFTTMAETKESKVFDNDDFGYWQITVERPLVENGVVKKDKKGRVMPDKNLRDTENVPFKYPGGIAGFFEKEVKPYVPDAWIDESATKVGYEISFTKYFYKPVQLRELCAIDADLKAVEQEAKDLLGEIVS